jgi:4-O-beta-D-mannosyl-D-glucose phosphorylase
MSQSGFKKQAQVLFKNHEKLLARRNKKLPGGNGIYDRYEFPVLTAAHAPILWRYDLDRKTNPLLLERMGINATFNAGALLHEGKFLLMARVEGADRRGRKPQRRGQLSFLELPGPAA